MSLQPQVQGAVDALVASGAERGLQVAVYQGGELTADAVAGVADPATGRVVTPATPFYNFSIGKGAASAVVHVLAERGVLAYDMPVVEVWPEFGAYGKDQVTVRHVLTHATGVPELPADTTAAHLCDWDVMCAAIAGARPQWEPGTKIGYHAWTFGFIVGELVRRATGKPIAQVLNKEVAEPLGVAGELYFGVPPAEHGRLARLEGAAATDAGPLSPTAEFGNRADILAADIPSTGTTSARAIARVYAALLGEVEGVRLISPKRLEEVSAIAASGVDAVYGNPAAWGLGYGIGLPGSPDRTTAFGMAGAGGSYAFADTATGIAFGLTKNRLTADLGTAQHIIQIVMGDTR